MMFESDTVSALSRLGFSIQRCGGTNDHGVDFRGEWTLDGQHSFHVLGQCKNEAKPCSSRHIREFLGVLLSRPLGDVLGVFASSSGYSEAARSVAIATDALVMLCSVQDGSVTQAFPNAAFLRAAPQLTMVHRRDVTGKATVSALFAGRILTPHSPTDSVFPTPSLPLSPP
jgi:hypothetical protein